jgi:hypothetical protein
VDPALVKFSFTFFQVHKYPPIQRKKGATQMTSYTVNVRGGLTPLRAAIFKKFLNTPFFHQTLPFHTSLQEDAMHIICNSIAVSCKFYARILHSWETKSFPHYHNIEKKKIGKHTAFTSICIH